MSDTFELVWGSGLQYEPCPEGIYDGEFVGVELMPEKDGMAEAIRFKFVVKGGPHDGKLTGNVGPRIPTPNNASGRIIAGMVGEGKPNEKINLKDCVGKTYQIVVAKNQAGRPVVRQAYPKK